MASWEDYFMTMVYMVASRSKDERTHIGAVIVNPRKNVISTGYNSFVRGANDFIHARQKKGEKQYWFAHAEVNAIYNANLPLEGCTMYTQGIPCTGCAMGIIQKGIVEVVVDKNWPNNSEESESNRRTVEMFAEVGVNLRQHDTRYVGVTKMNDGIESRL